MLDTLDVYEVIPPEFDDKLYEEPSAGGESAAYL
jgi:hypothetical protein